MDFSLIKYMHFIKN